MNEDVAAGLAAVRGRVARACEAAGRDPREVQVLLAVKTQPADVVRHALAAGATLLGHNRAQELVAMGPALAAADLPAHEMHFIGHLQSNKVNQVLRWVTCVQTVDSERLAARLDKAVAARGEEGPAEAAGPAEGSAPAGPLDVFVQVNTSGEPAKHGVSPDQAVELATVVGAAGLLRLRGLMTVGAHSADVDVVRGSYDRLARLRDAVVASGAPGTENAHELSMGMSGDLEVAVAAGATMVRVGTAVFGARPAP